MARFEVSIPPFATFQVSKKVIEEAPAPGITPKQRKTIGDRCIAACRDVGYRGAGTVGAVLASSHTVAR